MKSKRILFYLLYCLSLFGALFFRFPMRDFIGWFPLVIFMVLEWNKAKMFKHHILWILVFLFISCISCNIYRGQEILVTLLTTANILYLMFYFYLHYERASVAQMEKIIVNLFVIFSCCYLFQWLSIPTAYFSSALSEFDISENSVRLRMPGSGIASLAYFYAVNCLFYNKKIKYVLIIIVACFIILLMGFRSMLAGLLICSFLLFVSINGFNWKIFKYIFLVCVLGCLFLLIPQVQDSILGMIARQNADQSFSNDDYIRIIQLNFFENEHFHSIWERIFGSGMPNQGSYWAYFEDLMNRGIFWEDWGIIGLGWLIGIPATFIMILYVLKILRLKIDNRYKYIKFWFLYILLISVTTAEFIRNGNFLIQAMAFYLLDIVYKYNDNENRYNYIS